MWTRRVAQPCILISLWFAHAALAQQKVTLTNHEAPVLSIPFFIMFAAENTLVLSPDGHHGAYIIRDPSNGNEHVVIDGRPGEAYQRIERESLVYRPDSDLVVYAARIDKESYLVGGEGVKADVVGSSVQFSPDGKHVVLIGSTDKRWSVFVDGKPGEAFDGILDNRLVFSRAGRMAYVGLRAGRKVVVIDGAESLPFPDVSFPVFSADGDRAAYIVTDGVHSHIWFDDFARHEARDGIRPASLALSTDGTRVAYAFGSAPHMRVVAGRRGDEGQWPTAGEAYDWVFDDTLAFSPDGRRLAYAARRGDHCFVVVDGKPGPPFDGIVSGSIAFSNDSRRLAYVAEQVEAGGGNVIRSVVVDGMAWPAFERIRGVPRFSPDGSHVAYVAEHTAGGLTAQFIVVDGTSGKAYSCIRGEPVFSPDSKRVAVMAIAPDERLAAGEDVPRPDGNDAAPARRLILDRSDAYQLPVNPLDAAAKRPINVMLVEEQIGHD